MQRLREHANSLGIELTDPALAASLDASDELSDFRERFITPKAPAGSSLDGQPVVYLCGNSLGLQPRATHQYVQKQLEKWGEEAVEGHFTEPTKWLTIDDTVQDSLARLVGALPHEVVAMNSLTVNLHLMVGKVNLL